MKSRQSVCNQARAWLGRNEADGSHREIIDLYNQNRLHGTYAMTYSDPWCAAFVSAVGMACGMRDVILPHVNCDGMISAYQAKGQFIEDDAYVPSPGDIVFYDWQDSGAGDNRGSSDHVGIVTDVSNGQITVIEGNYSDAVKERRIGINGRYIRGFAVPGYDKSEDVSGTPSAPAENVGSVSQSAPSNSTTNNTVHNTDNKKDTKYIKVDVPELCIGMTGAYVASAQAILIARGYSCGPDGADGDFGANTLYAVKRFQRDKGLTVDGIIGVRTWTRLLAG